MSAGSGPADDRFDVAIIGAGVVGTAIARRIGRSSRAAVVIEARNDVGDGTSKANTAILHTGFDAPVGSLEAQLCRTGHRLLGAYAEATGIAVERTGALVVAWTPEQEAELPGLLDKARANDYPAAELIGPDELYRSEPHLAPGALGALRVPDESIICPWSTTLAYATEAVTAGVRLRLSTTVTGIEADPAGGHLILTSAGPIRAGWLINAAGLRSDEIDRIFGGTGFTVTPRRGQLVVMDKQARRLVSSIILPIPTSTTKGVLITPTVYGNLLVGPTAEDLDDKGDTATTPDGLRSLVAAGAAIVPGLAAEEVTNSYAGLRAATEHRDYQIRCDPDRRYVCVGGIRSTGLSASMAIAEHVAGLLGEAGMTVAERPDLPAPPRLPNLGEAFPRPATTAETVAADPEYGRIVCFCERVSRGELRDALAGPIPPVDRGGLARRTRASNGRCQGFYCGAEVAMALGGCGRTDAKGLLVSAAEHRHQVVVIGAGPAGLSAARSLAAGGVRDVLVVERERAAGGIPRHCDHTGFGLRDLHRSLRGPRYAERLARMAVDAGVRIETETMATGWLSPGVLALTSPAGVRAVAADAIVLATGARERPRAARLVSGDRGDGVFTTGQLQQWSHLRGLPVGERAVVVGAEHVSYSAVLTLRDAGVRTVAMVTDLPRHQSYAGFAAVTRRGLRVPLLTDTDVVAIRGHGRVHAVDVMNHTSGRASTLDVDTVVFTGDWIPDHELARSAGVAIDAVSGGPVVDLAGRCSVQALYAAGNLVHPAETADIAALRGAAVGADLAGRLLGGAARADPSGVAIVVESPLLWASPGRIGPSDSRSGAGLPGGLILRTAEFRRRPTVVIEQGQRHLARFTVRASVPNRSLRVPLGWSALVRPDQGDVRVRLDR